MRQPPDSGTPLGNKVLDLMTHGGIGLVAPAIGAGGYAAYNGESPLESTGWGVAGLLAAGLGARGATTLMNRPEVFGSAFRRLPAAVPAYNQNDALHNRRYTPRSK